MHRMRQQKLSAGFCGWYSNVQTSKKQRAIVTRVVQRMQRRTIAGALDAWVKHVAALKMHAATQAGNERRLELAVARIRALAVHRALRSWAAWAYTAKAHRVIVQRVLARLHQRQLSVPFWSWHESVQTSKRQRYVCERAVLRMGMQLLAAALDAWHEQVRTVIGNRVKIGRLVARLEAGAVRSGWTAWVVWVAEERQGRLNALVRTCRTRQPLAWLHSVLTALRGLRDSHAVRA